LGQPFDIGDLAQQHDGELLALAVARLDERIERVGKALEDAGVARGTGRRIERQGLVLDDHTLEGEQAVDMCRQQAGFLLDLTCQLDRRRQRSRVDAQTARTLLGLDRQRCLQRTALEAFIGEDARGGLDAVETRWRAKPQIEAAAVDALHLPAPSARCHVLRCSRQSRSC
jgi:hypothetical protein